MKLKIKSNKFLYYKNFEFENFEIELNGDLEYNSDKKIDIIIEKFEYLRFANINSFHLFSEEIRGKSKESVLYNILKHNIEKSENFIAYLERLNEFSFNSFKSIFLIYNWLEIPLLNQEENDFDINKNLYDDFVIDWTFRPESQKDIYLIKKDYIVRENLDYLEHLKKINLLTEITIYPYRNERLISYFIPLNQPGLSKSLFEFEDEFGIRKNSYSLWKRILRDRDIRIGNWINNRY